jgi:putative Mg2+ transporter-C (MgtC) family protein
MFSLTDLMLRLSAAFLLGAVIGTERQWRQRMAGLRTNMLVSLGACMFVAMGSRIGGDAVGRITSYVVSGIGFLGAGVIMKDGINVRGLTTAATVWCSGAVGAFCGDGFLAEAATGTSFILITHLLMRPFGIWLSRLPTDTSSSTQIGYMLVIKCRQDVENHVRLVLLRATDQDDRLILRSLKSNDEGDPMQAVIVAEIMATGNEDCTMEKIAGRLTIEHQVKEVSWNKIDNDNDL